MNTKHYMNYSLEDFQEIYFLIEKFRNYIHSFKNIIVPTLLPNNFLEQQGIELFSSVPFVTAGESNYILSASAEQGILEFFKNSTIDKSISLFAENQCFRQEKTLVPNIRCYEFFKIELFSFFIKENNRMAQTYAEFVNNFYVENGLETRIVEKTKEDPGYHISKYDVEAMTKDGWLEICSSTYFGDEQAKRFNIKTTQNKYLNTASCTGITFPRFFEAWKYGQNCKR